MITRSEMLPLLVEACPSFSKLWEEHREEYRDEENYLPYIALGEFGRHLIELHDKNDIAEFPVVFETVERLHVEGDDYVREAATIGLLEGIQNQLGNARRNPESFRTFLGPVTAKWWDQLNSFWEGEIDYVGATLER